jgi:hypothetical protein
MMIHGLEPELLGISKIEQTNHARTYERALALSDLTVTIRGYV